MEDLLPGDMTVVSRQVGESFPIFNIASAHIGEEGSEESVAMTLDMSRIDPGLESEDGADVRVELLIVHQGHSGVGPDLLATAATMISEDPMERSPQPGLTLPGLAGHVDGSITATHGVLVVPFVWSQGVPHILEVAQNADGETQEEFTHPGRMTVPAQLVMLTDEEFAVVESEGLGAAQRYIVENNINVNDLWRQ
ncbi:MULTISPECIES: hypothetical protein [Corynebacterium]|uniref:hypothetical protein n=1 Tax=Corynebacterium TaxID=1716 RepID=UPI001E5A7BAA|nr:MULTISPECIES: hypothetical protein [Corynebacterium]